MCQPAPAGTEALLLARDGKALAPIVAPARNGVAGFAARELKSHLDRITGAEFALAASAPTPPRIFVGDCPEARAAGLDVGKLKRDGFYRAVKGGDLFLPVDVYIPGCPPRSEALVEGLMLIQQKIEKEPWLKKAWGKVPATTVRDPDIKGLVWHQKRSKAVWKRCCPANASGWKLRPASPGL